MNSLDMILEQFAAREPEPALVSGAQDKLEATIARRLAAVPVRRPTARARGWLAAAATAAVVAVAMLWLPFGSVPALAAFAKIQEHFRDFRTLRFDVEQRMNGQLIMKSRVSVTQDGNVRTDVGDDVTVIVNSTQRQVLTLMHRSHVAVASPLDKPATADDAIRWLDDIREFQGEAKVLPNTRWIRGHRTHGWRLATAAGEIVLWATDEGLPFEMTLDSSTPLKLSFNFEFNPTLDAKFFSTEIPAGYSRAESED
jgi:outer membrane lipoprotein-sorting protein